VRNKGIREAKGRCREGDMSWNASQGERCCIV
jgi:hypothetical protein